jgi:hypothetical protein
MHGVGELAYVINAHTRPRMNQPRCTTLDLNNRRTLSQMAKGYGQQLMKKPAERISRFSVSGVRHYCRPQVACAPRQIIMDSETIGVSWSDFSFRWHDYLDTVTGEVRRGQIAPADRVHLRAWLGRFAGRDDAAFAVEGCAGWRYVSEELAAAGIAAHLGEPADTAALRGRKRHAKTGKTDARHLRTLLAEGRLPGAGFRRVTSWNTARCWRPITTCGASTPPGCSASMRCSSTKARPCWAKTRCAPSRA